MPSADAAAQRLARREQLSRAILEGFETPGWRWTDRQMLDDVRSMFENAHATFSGPREIRENIVRNFGESQVQPRHGALLPLCRRFQEELLQAMQLSSKRDFRHVHAIFANHVFDTELQGIVESSELFPLPYAPRNEAWFRAISGLAKTFKMVSEGVLTSTEFNTVLWITGQAAMRVLQHLHRVRNNRLMANYHGTELADEDHDERLAEESDQPERARLRQNLALLPPEIRTIIFGQVMTKLTRVWEVRSNHTYAARCLDSILNMLSDKEFVPQYSINSSGHIRRERHRFTRLEGVCASFREEVEEAVTGTLHLDQVIDFSVRNTHRQLPFPRIIADKTQQLRHLNLLVEMVMPYSSALFYPSSLYSAQDYLASLKSLFPALKTIEVTVLDRLPGHNNVAIVPKSRQGDLTTKYAAMAELVQCLSQTKIQEKWIRYKTDSRISDYDNRLEAREDRTMADIDSFVGAMITWEGVALEIKPVGSGVGSVWEGN